MSVPFIDAASMDRWLEQAAQAPRKRTHHNLHPSLDAPVQRLAIALSQGTYVRPHRHPQPNRWEMIHALQGETTLVLFDDHGHPTRKILLSPQVMPVVECPANTWHSLYPTQGQIVIMEVKEGPYLPNLPEHFAPWAPEENTPEVEAYLARIMEWECQPC